MSFVPQAWQWRTAPTVRSWLWPLWTVRSLSGTRTRPHKTAPLLDDTTCRQAARRRIKSQPSSPPRASEWMGFEPQVWFHWFKSSRLMWLYFFLLSLVKVVYITVLLCGRGVCFGWGSGQVCLHLQHQGADAHKEVWNLLQPVLRRYGGATSQSAQRVYFHVTWLQHTYLIASAVLEKQIYGWWLRGFFLGGGGLRRRGEPKIGI